MDQTVNVSDRGKALDALSLDQQKRLAALARLLAINTGEDGDDLLSRARVRWMESNEPVEGASRTFEFLVGAMRSFRFNTFRHQKIARKVDGVRVVTMTLDGPDPIELGVDPASSQEDAVYAQQLYDLCANDSDVQAFVMYEADQATKASIQAEMNWDDKKYDAVRKRRSRMIARWKLEGILP